MYIVIRCEQNNLNKNHVLKTVCLRVHVLVIQVVKCDLHQLQHHTQQNLFHNSSLFFSFVDYVHRYTTLQCFDAVGWATGRTSGL